MSTSVSDVNARFLPLESCDGVELLDPIGPCDWGVYWRTVEAADAGATGRGACIGIFWAEILTGDCKDELPQSLISVFAYKKTRSSVTTTKDSPCLICGVEDAGWENNPNLPWSTDALDLGADELCKNPGGDGDEYGARPERPGGVVDDRVLSGVSGRTTGREPLATGGETLIALATGACPFVCLLCGQPFPTTTFLLGPGRGDDARALDLVGGGGGSLDGRILRGLEIEPVEVYESRGSLADLTG